MREYNVSCYAAYAESGPIWFDIGCVFSFSPTFLTGGVYAGVEGRPSSNPHSTAAATGGRRTLYKEKSMADKGGSGTPLNTRGKGVKKTVAPPRPGRGKDDSVAKKTEHVQLDSSDSDFEGFVEERTPKSADVSGQKSGKKVSFETFKSGGKGGSDKGGDGGKGGKGSSVGKSGGEGTLPSGSGKGGDGGKGGKGSSVGKSGGEGSLPYATPLVTEVELKLELDIPKGARILMDSEAAGILQDIQESMTILSKDPKIKMPEAFSHGVQYSKINHHYKDVKRVRKHLESLKMHGVTDGEICMIGNVCPETVEEVYALVPSLKANRRNNEDAIKGVLSEMAKFKIPK